MFRSEASEGLSKRANRVKRTKPRFRSLRNQDFAQTLQRNRENLLGLPAGQPLEPVVSYGVEQVYFYYSKTR